MSPERYLLDTSALLTLIEDERGAERVEQALTEDEVCLPWLVLLEAYYVSLQERGQAEADRRYALAKHLPAAIAWEMDEPVLLIVSGFSPS